MNAQLLLESKRCEEKWGNMGLLEDISNVSVRRNTAVLLENQTLFNEQSTGVDDIANFSRISIPLVRRIYPQLIANHIVSVQPLLGPAGLVYYLRYRYSTDKGDMLGASNQANEDSSMQQKADGTVNLSIYYSSEIVDSETISAAGGAATQNFTLAHSPVKAGTLTGSIFDGAVEIATFVTSSANAVTITDVGTPTPSVSSATFTSSTNVLAVTFSADPGACSVVVSYQYNMECNSDLPEINVEVSQETIEATARKLSAKWSFESQQDIRAQYSLDLEAELTQHMAQEINLEIDREIIKDLRDNAGTTATWDLSAQAGDTIKEKYESLYIKIAQVSTIIHRKTLRGEANFIVTSPEVASILQYCTAGFAPIPTETFTGGLGVQYVGSIANKWKIYKDPSFPANKLLLGYKGDSYMDSGYFYCPYIPLTQTPVVINPTTYCPGRALMTRYGKKMLSTGAKYYATITISNFSIA